MSAALCLVCDDPTSGRDWCSRRHRNALRSLGRALRPGTNSRDALQHAVAHRRTLAAEGINFPTELVPIGALGR